MKEVPPQQFNNSSKNSSESEMEREIKVPRQNKTDENETLNETKEPIRRRSLRKLSSQEVRWERGPLVGQGTYGKVYQGLNLNTGKLIAIKSILIGGK